MKNKISMLIIISLFLTGCLQEQRDDFAFRMFRGHVEDFSSTKTTLGDENMVLWSEGDMISVFEDNDESSCYKITDESAGKSNAEFVEVADIPDGTSIGANVAVYPYLQSARCARLSTGDFRISGFELPAVQYYSENSFASGVFPMAAMTSLSDNVFDFKNLCGVLKLQLKGEESVRYIVVEGNDGEKLSGPAWITVHKDGSSHSISMRTGADKQVSLDCGKDGVKLHPDVVESFLIVLPPTSFSSGFTITVETVGGEKVELSTSKSNEVQRSRILCMPEKTIEIEYPVLPPKVSIETLAASYDDVSIKVKVENAVQYAGGYKLKSEFNISQILREANWKIVPRIDDVFEYEGSMTAFPSGKTTDTVIPGQTYTVWVAPYSEGQTLVSSDNIVSKDIRVPDIASGGSLNVTEVSSESEFTSLTAEVSAPGARFIFAGFVTESELASLSSVSAKVSWLKNNATRITGPEGTVTRSGLTPDMPVTLLAIAIDDAGRYGSVLNKTYFTAVPVFNEKISIDLSASIEEKEARINVSAKGGEVARFYYFADKASSSSWTRVLGGTREAAEEFIPLHKDNYLINNTDDDPFEDDCIVMDEVMMDEKHVVVVMAEDVDGMFSRAYMLAFTPELDLGDFFYSTGSTRSQWMSTKPAVSFGKCYQEEEFYIINWAVTPASGTTAYAVCTHPNVMQDCSTSKDMAVRIYNIGKKVVPGKMETLLYGDKGNLVYVTWRDKSGNFYEPVSIAVP